MLQVARLTPNMLGRATDRVAEFFEAQAHVDGGVADRAGNSDLYYTVFGLEGQLALQAPLPEVSARAYLTAFGSGSHLDFVHAACLARCWACLPTPRMGEAAARALAGHLESCRSADGGYAANPDSPRGTVYHCFLALGAYQDLGLDMPDGLGLLRCIGGLRTGDGAYANEAGLPVGMTPATAAAVTVLRHFGEPVPSAAGAWLLERAHPAGGFVATQGIAMPDLLSTATALHALAGMHLSFEHLKEPSLDFIDSLWTGKAFCGSWADDAEDCEYTYYALLALGHLSL